jgi:hypothetical protein
MIVTDGGVVELLATTNEALPAPCFSPHSPALFLEEGEITKHLAGKRGIGTRIGERGRFPISSNAYEKLMFATVKGRPSAHSSVSVKL